MTERMGWCRSGVAALLGSVCLCLVVTASAEDSGGFSQVVALDESAELATELVSAFDSLGPDYEPRTEHFLEDGAPRFINRLIREDSPYLLQHAHNPVNWYPWGEEAFARASAEDKPIFLSIGYATCHWCHVMERESFENTLIADFMNEHFISIKVDREQLPDVDSMFMTAVMMINGSGGWPMSSFLDVDGRPFYGGTYFPPDNFHALLGRVVELWHTDRSPLLEQATELAGAMRESQRLSGTAVDIGDREIDRALVDALSRFDGDLGGFGGAPKFPQESTLFFLLEQARVQGNADALAAASFSLKRMAAGGIHDQIGGGFHRYAVDDRWLVPHFEKMLYNQGALARVYTEAFQLTGDEEHARTARGVLDYVLREMRTPDGVFYSATDADSPVPEDELRVEDTAEGIFFVWTPDELRNALSAEDAQRAIDWWGVTDMGNFESRNILFRPHNAAEFAAKEGMSEAQLHDWISGISTQLRAVRERRAPPPRDDKIITAWNSMIISALVVAAEALDEPRYLDAAVVAADRLWAVAEHDDGQLWRASYAGRASIPGTQADYAFLAEAAVYLYDATGEQRWLNRARGLAEVMIDQFWDAEEGGFFMGSEAVAGATLVSRPKDLHDTSMPSGNAVALRVLSRLHRRTGDITLGQQADELIAALSTHLATRPGGFHYFLKAVSEHVQGESGARQYGGRGVVRATAERVDDRVEVRISMAPGWHINAAEPLQEYLIGTRLTLADERSLPDTVYPEAVQRTLGFQRAELALYEGEVVLSAALPEPGTADSDSSGLRLGTMMPLQLRLQACNDEICLAPESLPLQLSLVSVR